MLLRMLFKKYAKKDVMNDALFAPLLNYNESQQADWHIKQNVIAHPSEVREDCPRVSEATKRRYEALRL